MNKVKYVGMFKGNIFDIWTWEGTPLSVVWNEYKQWYLPGDKVLIADNHGNAREFRRGLI